VTSPQDDREELEPDVDDGGASTSPGKEQADKESVPVSPEKGAVRRPRTRESDKGAAPGGARTAGADSVAAPAGSGAGSTTSEPGPSVSEAGADTVATPAEPQEAEAAEVVEPVEPEPAGAVEPVEPGPAAASGEAEPVKPAPERAASGPEPEDPTSAPEPETTGSEAVGLDSGETESVVAPVRPRKTAPGSPADTDDGRDAAEDHAGRKVSGPETDGGRARVVGTTTAEPETANRIFLADLLAHPLPGEEETAPAAERAPPRCAGPVGLAETYSRLTC